MKEGVSEMSVILKCSIVVGYRKTFHLYFIVLYNRVYEKKIIKSNGKYK